MMTAEALPRLLSRIALEDDAFAYRELFMHYHAKLVVFAKSITGVKELAEEVVSDVFLKLWLNRSSLTQIDNFHLYLYVAVRNLSINQAISQKSQPFSFDHVQIELADLDHNPEQLLMTKEMYKRVARAIDGLPPKCRLIFKLIREDGLKYKEVAELLHLSLKTVENQMTIAIRKIGASVRYDLSPKKV
jgi:RNA polymerase sigma-70 factor (ECF subfamily)